MAPAVTVLLPFRDCADTLDAAIEAIQRQTVRDIELLAIDDGSTDDGPARVAARARDDRRIRLLRTGGVGIARALNHGLARASASIIARMDGDDRCAPTRFARQLEALGRAPRAGCIATRVRAFPDDAVGEGLRRYVAWQNQLVTPADHRRALLIEAPICHPSAMLRAEALREVDGWRDIDGPEDYDLWLRLDAAGWDIAKVPEVLFEWRHHSGRSTFADPRYGRDRFLAIKTPHVARAVRDRGLPLTVWGAGRTGKRLARALEPFDIRARRFVDIAARKIGGVARGVPIVSPRDLQRGRETVLVAVSARGAREDICEYLDGVGWRDGADYLCAA